MSDLLWSSPTVNRSNSSTIWVQLTTSDPTQLSKAVAFRVKPDGLKKAVKAEMQLTIPAPLLRVYAHDASADAWVEVPKASAPLTSNK